MMTYRKPLHRSWLVGRNKAYHANTRKPANDLTAESDRFTAMLTLPEAGWRPYV